LIDQIDTFVNERVKEFESHGDFSPRLLHCDANVDNVMGDWFKVSVLADQVEEMWLPTTLIDFGDARFGDPLFELIPIFVSILQCDIGRFRLLLRELGLSLDDAALRRRLMLYAVVWPFSGPVKWIWRHRTDMCDWVTSLEEMEEALFQPIK
jgi:aminoglycoside phosphotransferase (APT) family kinase protein